MDRIGLFSGQKALKTDAHFASIFGPFPWPFLLIFQAVTPYSITGRKFYCQNHKKNLPAPEKIFRGSSKNFSGFHEKFWPVSRDHFACHFKVIWPVPRFAFVPKWTKSLAGGIGEMGRMRPMGVMGLMGVMGNGAGLEGLLGPLSQKQLGTVPYWGAVPKLKYSVDYALLVFLPKA